MNTCENTYSGLQGLIQTRIDSVREIIPMRVRGYDASQSGVLQNAPLSDTSNRLPGGGFVSTVEDLMRFRGRGAERYIAPP